MSSGEYIEHLDERQLNSLSESARQSVAEKEQALNEIENDVMSERVCIQLTNEDGFPIGERWTSVTEAAIGTKASMM